MQQPINRDRLAKNSILLYFRQIIITLVSLYTSRVVLSVLGEEDYGIYNLVGGVVVLFFFFNTALSSATQRFISYELGKGNDDGVTRVFSMSINIHLLFALILFIIAETIGLYIIHHFINVSPDRVLSARCAYQFSILSVCIQMLRVPFSAMIIANERMNFYAYISIIEALLKLCIVYLLVLLPFDSLVVYTVLLLMVHCILLLCYYVYTTRFFSSAKYIKFWDSLLFKRVLGFSGWSLLGGASNTASSYGVNIIMNSFCGVTVNAAIGIANQVSSAVGSMLSSFQTAFAPQIVKSYSAEDTKGYYNLIIESSKYSYFLLLFITVPVISFATPILQIWLVNVPSFTVDFTKLILLYTLIDSLAGPFWHAINATGRIKGYNIAISIVMLLNLPISFVLLKCGVSVIWVVATRVILNVLLYLIRVYIIRVVTHFPIKAYCYTLIRYVFPPTILSSALCFIKVPDSMSLLSLILLFSLSCLFVLSIIYVLGIDENEKVVIKGKLSRMLYG